MRNSAPWALAAALLVAATPGGHARAGPDDPQTVASGVMVEATALVVLRPDGRRVEGTALIGAVVVGGGEEAGRSAFRIDGVRADPDDPEITLYDLSTRTGDGRWQPYCAPDDRGVAGSLFLAGSWDGRGTHRPDDLFSTSCTSGAIGKCVRAGFKPWKPMPDGRSGWDYHQACTRMIRADYCGDGRGQTRNGIQIEIISRWDPEDPGTSLRFEAGWTPEGASCVARPRLGNDLGLVAAPCPTRLRGRLGASCTLAGELSRTEVLLVNKSPAGQPIGRVGSGR